jgi:hypothetical protein
MVVTAVASVAPVHEQVDDRARKKQQPGKGAHHVGSVLGPEEVSGDGQEGTEPDGERSPA